MVSIYQKFPKIQREEIAGATKQANSKFYFLVRFSLQLELGF